MMSAETVHSNQKIHFYLIRLSNQTIQLVVIQFSVVLASSTDYLQGDTIICTPVRTPNMHIPLVIYQVH